MSNAVSLVDIDFSYGKALLWKVTTPFLKAETVKNVHCKISYSDSDLALFNSQIF